MKELDSSYRNTMSAVLELVRAEVESARSRFGPMASHHEAYAVILEELDEYKEEVWKKRQNRSPCALRTELVQIAAMAVATIVELADRDEEDRDANPAG